jgi:hypothetical protein
MKYNANLQEVHVRRYQSSDENLWNDFLARSKNGSFLFHRNYMEYHRERFEDASLLVFNRSDQLIALAPANRKGDVFQSHGGLTYGGIVIDERMSAALFLEIFKALLAHLQERSIAAVEYKTIPHIYHRYMSEEDLYALFLCGAEIYRCDALSVIGYPERPRFRKGRISERSKARRLGLRVERSEDWEAYWDILTENLRSRYGQTPTHDINEILLLKSRFPSNIHLHCAYNGAELQSGCVIYETERVAHLQYMASTPQARQTGALDLLLSHLIEDVYAHKAFFDFGISNEDNGHYLNHGLIDFKEGFGARTVVQQFFRVDCNRIDIRALDAGRRSNAS